MALTPQKIHFDMQSRSVWTADGLVPQSDNLYPGIKIGQRDNYINIQLYDGDISTTYTKLAADTVGQFLTDNDYNNANWTDFLLTSNWTASGSGTSEYYYSETISEPRSVYGNATLLASGTVGSLTAGQWAFADNDSIGESRVYVRLSDSTDPDTKTAGYLQYVDDSTYTPLFIQALADTFNLANSWLDDDGTTMRTPDITAGELSFKISSATEDFATRLGTSSAASGTWTEVQLFDASTNYFDTIKFTFRCENRLLPAPMPQDANPDSYHTKTEALALFAKKAYSESATLTDNQANNISLGSASTYQAITVKGYIRNAAGSVNYFSGAVYHNGTTAETNIKLSDFGAAFITGVTFPFSADISSGNLRLIITLSSAGENLTCKYGIENLIEV